jgi:predicted anti-sigma-YlaC factor YlaD
VIGSLIRLAFDVLGGKHETSLVRKPRRRKLPVSTRQWLVLTFGIAILVGVLFIVTLLYLQPGK